MDSETDLVSALDKYHVEFLEDIAVVVLSEGLKEPCEQHLEESIKQCQYCHTQKSPMWRRGPNQVLLCNRCGLRAKKHIIK